jgi:hypothetical protein
MSADGRRPREAQHQAERLRSDTGPLPQWLRRLVDRFDTREGIEDGASSRRAHPGLAQASERVLPERAVFVPRFHPLGGLVLRTRVIQNLLGDLAGNGQLPDKRRTSGTVDCVERLGRNPDADASPPDQSLTDAEIAELRREAMMSALHRSSQRWGGR